MGRVLNMSLLRGVCQSPAYAAYEAGFFAEAGLDVKIHIAATAWMVPHLLTSGETQFAIMPWTRVAAGRAHGAPMVVVAGSGIEEAAIVLRNGIEPDQVRSVAVPKEGGIKDLTAMALIESMGWSNVNLVRQPSGDGAIISLFGRGAEASSMVEPYATMFSDLGIGRTIRRTGDCWPGAPGCSLTTSFTMIENEPDTVQAMVDAHVRGARFVAEHPDEAAKFAAKYIGIDAGIIAHAFQNNRPDPQAVRNQSAMDAIIELMIKLGYIKTQPEGYLNLRFLDRALQQR